MKRIHIEDTWKDSWKYSYPYDLLEIYEEYTNDLGYAFAYENRRDQTFSLISKVAKPGAKVLDVAASQGNFSLKLAEMGYEVTWNDIRSDLVEYVKMKHTDGKIEYKPGNVFEIDHDHLFDVVLATEIIEHVAHPDEFLFSLSKLVKPTGHIVISTPLGSYFQNNLPKFTEFANPDVFESKQFGPNADDHIFLIHLDEISHLAKKADLEVVDVKYYTNPLTNGHLGLSRVLRILPKNFIFKLEHLTQKLPDFIGKKIHTNFSVLLRKSS